VSAPEAEQLEIPDPREQFADYLEQSVEQEAANLGYLVVFSVIDKYVADVTVDQLTRLFRTHGLDETFLPAAIRPADVFERTTRRWKTTYILDENGAPTDKPRGQKRRPNELRREVTLTIRPVFHNDDVIERHLVRELRDEATRNLEYESHLARFVFHIDTTAPPGSGAGRLVVRKAGGEIGKLGEAEQAKVLDTIEATREKYRRSCHYLSPERLRTMLRSYVGGIEHSVRILPTAGVYFVYRSHGPTLAKLRDVANHFGPGSTLRYVPLLPKGDTNGRELVSEAVAAQAAVRLAKLSGELVAVSKMTDPDPQVVLDLRKRFTELSAEAEAHARLLSTSLDDTEAALKLVRKQFSRLLVG
jgi:hypothetical protein